MHLRPPRLSAQRTVQDALQDLPRIKVGFNDLPGRPAVPLVSVVHPSQSIDGFSHGGKAEDPLPIGKEGARPGILNHRRLPAGQIAESSVADPGVLELHARRLGAAKLAARPLDIGLIRFRSAGDCPGVADPPAMALKDASVLRIPLVVGDPAGTGGHLPAALALWILRARPVPITEMEGQL